MVFIVTLSVSQIFNFVYASGENEIVNYSMMSTRPADMSQLVTFDFAVKPSTMINYKAPVQFITDPDFDKLDELLEYKGGPTFVIVKNKNFDNDDNYRKNLEKRLERVQTGKRYSLYVKDTNNEYNNEYAYENALRMFMPQRSN